MSKLGDDICFWLGKWRNCHIVLHLNDTNAISHTQRQMLATCVFNRIWAEGLIDVPTGVVLFLSAVADTRTIIPIQVEHITNNLKTYIPQEDVSDLLKSALGADRSEDTSYMFMLPSFDQGACAGVALLTNKGPLPFPSFEESGAGVPRALTMLYVKSTIG